jgi:hypothetical protein
MPSPGETKRVLIVVRTYPTPAKHGVEVSCTAGITDKGQWIRLFPVPYRFLTPDQRFRKYQWIDVNVEKASDPRPESHRLFADTIKILSEPLPTDQTWQARKNFVLPLKAQSLCALQRERDQHKFPTLGLFKPKRITQLLIEPDDPNWSETQLGLLRQGLLFENGPQIELEKVPYKFRYEFSCDDTGCPGHKIVCTDWEMGQSWRKWKDDYGSGWEAKFRQRYESDMIHKNDTHFYVGTMNGHPHVWIIVGLFYPPQQAQGSLF